MSLVELAHGVPALHPEEKGRLNISPKSNWVEKRGGLPPYLNSVANALVRKGMTRSRAIATAVNVMKKTCATGLWGGHPGQSVSAAIRAAACSAVTRWEAMKVSTSVPSDERFSINLAERWKESGSLEFAWDRMRARALIDLAPTTMERKRAESKGQAMQGGRFPIRNRTDLEKAIPAVGRARPNTEAERAKVRRFVIRRARALGLSSLIPDAWQADGSLR